MKKGFYKLFLTLAMLVLGVVVQVNAQLFENWNFEDGGVELWQATGNPVNTAMTTATGSDARTGIYAAKAEWNRTQTASQSFAVFYNLNGAPHIIDCSTTVHYIAWVKTSPAMPSMSNVWGLCLVGSNLSKTFSATNILASASSNNSYTTSYERYSASWTRPTNYSCSATSAGRFHPKIAGGTFPSNAAGQKWAFYFDDVIIYTSTDGAPTDLAKPTAPTFTTCTTSELTWTNGNDVGSGVSGAGATGIQATILLKTTNLSASDPVLNDQAVFTTGNDENDRTGGDWEIVATNIAASATTYNITTTVDTKYALVHRDLAYNYSIAAVTTVVTATAPTVTTTPDAATGLDFGSIPANGTKELTLNVKGVLLTGDLSITSDNLAFSLGGVSSITQADAEATEGKDIVVTFDPTAEDTYSGKIIISGGGLTQDVEVPVSGVAIAADETKPTLLNSSPADEAKDVALDDTIKIKFSEDIRITDVTKIKLNTVTVDPTKVSASNDSLLIIPTLEGCTSYTVSIEQGAVTDLVGNIADAISFEFKTEEASQGYDVATILNVGAYSSLDDIYAAFPEIEISTTGTWAANNTNGCGTANKITLAQGGVGNFIMTFPHGVGTFTARFAASGNSRVVTVEASGATTASTTVTFPGSGGSSACLSSDVLTLNTTKSTTITITNSGASGNAFLVDATFTLPILPITLTSATGTDEQEVMQGAAIETIVYQGLEATPSIVWTTSKPDNLVETPNTEEKTLTISGTIASETAIGDYEYTVSVGECSSLSGKVSVTEYELLAPEITLTSDAATTSQIVKGDGVTAIADIIYTLANEDQTTGATIEVKLAETDVTLISGITGTYDNVNHAFTIEGTPNVSALGITTFPAVLDYKVIAAPQSGYVGNEVAATGTITIRDANAKKIAYVINTALSAKDTKIYPSLLPIYEVTTVKIADVPTADLSSYDLVILTEEPGTNSDGMRALRGIEKPLLNFKSYAVRDNTWNWKGAAGSNPDPRTSSVSVHLLSHPIFAGLGLTDDNKDLAILDAITTGNGIQAETGLTQGYSLATTSAGISIHEVPSGTVMAVNDGGTPYTMGDKYLMIAISNDNYDKVSATGIQLIKNACDYLINGTPFSASSDATLSSLTYNSGTSVDDFDADTLPYSVVLEEGTITVPIDVEGIATDSKATVDITQATSLESPNNVATVKVTAEDGITVNSYTITFTVDQDPFTTGTPTFDLTNDVITENSITIAWNAYTDAATYALTVKDASSSVVGSPYTGITSTSQEVTGLDPNTTYTFELVAYKADGITASQTASTTRTTDTGTKDSNAVIAGKVYTSGSNIVVETENASSIQVLSIQGAKVFKADAAIGTTIIPVTKGAYIVIVNGAVVKVIL